MSSSACTILGGAVLALLLAGYLAQRYLPPPKPRIIGIDLGTTFSCVGVFHAKSGEVEIFEVDGEHKCIPSVVTFSGNDVLVGFDAMAQAEHNPENTFSDAKRFIGKYFEMEELLQEAQRYPFVIKLDEHHLANFVGTLGGNQTLVSPSAIGSYIISALKTTAERALGIPITKAVISVPAEFDDTQRAHTKLAANLAGLEVVRIINEPTAAAMAYGLHERKGFHVVMVVDLGGGTLDVSLLYVQNGMFMTQATAGNNHLGGQDFNRRLFLHVLDSITTQFSRPLTDPEDLQSLRTTVENAKLNLTYETQSSIELRLRSFRDTPKFSYLVTRDLFEKLNSDLFAKILEPIEAVLIATEMQRSEVKEVVLVGGSTRIPKVRHLIEDYFGRAPHTSVDADLAVVTGVSVQAGILSGAWPLKVSAIELPAKVKKIQLT